MSRLQLSANFAIEELDCHDGTHVPPELLDNARAVVVDIAQPLRDWYGKKLVVVSGYRTPDHNRAVKGAPLSDHLTARALDLKPEDGRVGALARLIKEKVDEGKLPSLGYVEICPQWVHVSLRARVNGKVVWQRLDPNTGKREPIVV
jgi:hypothetical protein